MKLRLRRTCPVPDNSSTRYASKPKGLRAMLSGQAAHPHGWLGPLLARIWVHETARANDAALRLLDARPGDKVLEVGFGPGATLGKLGSKGIEVVGVEVSDSMIALARRRNAALVRAGMIELRRAEPSSLPLADAEVSGCLAVHNIYFWPDQAALIAEMHRTLRPAGRAVIVMHAGEAASPGRFDPSVYRVPTTWQVVEWMDAVGFVDTQVAWGISGSDHVAAVSARKAAA